VPNGRLQPQRFVRRPTVAAANLLQNA